MIHAPICESYDSYVRDLIEFSAKVSTQRSRRPNHYSPTRDWSLEPQYFDTQGVLVTRRATAIAVATDIFDVQGTDAGDPAAPLRCRDIQALVEYFAHDQIEMIEADVCRFLSHVYPEPCWEDEPYDVLYSGI